MKKKAIHSFQISRFNYPTMQHHILENGILKYITAKTSQFTVLQHDHHYGHASRHNEVFVIYPSATHPLSLNIKYILIQFDMGKQHWTSKFHSDSYLFTITSFTKQIILVLSLNVVTNIPTLNWTITVCTLHEDLCAFQCAHQT